MPNQLKIRIWGKYFGLETSLTKADGHGFLPEQSRYWRIPTPLNEEFNDYELAPVDAALLLKGFTGTKLESASKLTQQAILPKSIKQIGSLINWNLSVLDLGFEQSSLTSAETETHTEMRMLQQLNRKEAQQLIKQYKLNPDIIRSNCNSYPLVATDFSTIGLHYQLVRDSLKILEKLSPETDHLVLTGELIWSGWLNLYMICLLINLIGRDIDVIIDYSGIWQFLLQPRNILPQLYKLDSSFFVSDLSWCQEPPVNRISKEDSEIVLRKGKIERKLIPGKRRTGLFVLPESGYSYENGRKLAMLVYLNAYRFMLPELKNIPKLSTWWKEPIQNIRQAEYFYLGTNSLNIQKRNLFIASNQDKKFSLYNSAGDILKAGNACGREIVRNSVLIDISKYHLLRKDIFVSDGEYVTKGKVLFRASTLGGAWEKEVVVPIDGKVDLKLFEKGFILIHESLERAFIMPFTARLQSKSVSQGIHVEAETISLPLIISSNDHWQGFLNWGEVSGEYDENILVLNSPDDFDLNAEAIFAQHIKGVLFMSAEEKILSELIQKKMKTFSFLGFGLITQLSLKPHQEIIKLFKFYNGNYAIVDNSMVSIPFDSANFTFKELKPAVETEGLSRAADALKKGEIVRVINYSDSYPYARIEKIQSKNRFLAATDEAIEDLYAANTLDIKY